MTRLESESNFKGSASNSSQLTLCSLNQSCICTTLILDLNSLRTSAHLENYILTLVWSYSLIISQVWFSTLFSILFGFISDYPYTSMCELLTKFGPGLAIYFSLFALLYLKNPNSAPNIELLFAASILVSGFNNISSFYLGF